MSRFTAGQTVYLPDGRAAEYVLDNGLGHFVRIIHEAAGGYDEPPYSYPSDTITTAPKVYASEPVEVWGKQVLAKREQVRELDRELTAKRAEIANAGRTKAEMEKAAAKYPCIQQALDFIEGRITHVVVHHYSGALKIATLKETFEQTDTWHGRRKFEGMKLLNLFGTDENGRNVAWGLNQYRDGSGSSCVQIDPARSEGHAMQIVSARLLEAVEIWRSGGNPRISIPITLDENPWLTPPDDWIARTKAQKEKQRAAKIEKLRAQLAELESSND